MIAFFEKIIVFIVSGAYLICSIFMGNGFDSIIRYKNTVKDVSAYTNTIKTAVPQTEIYDAVKGHFESQLPAGKTQKKAIVIGYDGCRADCLSLINDEHPSAIGALLEDGGFAAITYCGGKNFPLMNNQATSTAPGWCSMLTGVWADKHGITDNSIVKSMEYPTLLTSLVEGKVIDDSAFYVSWGGHFTDSNSTYFEEKNYIEEKGLDVSFLRANDDAGTFANTVADLKKADCSDFIFSIFEYPDHTGHDEGFSLYNDEYPAAFYEAEETGLQVINAIKSRPAYNTEDWLIIITSDHGGSTFGHGGMSIQERITFAVSNKEIF